MPSNLQESCLETQNKEKIISEFLTKSTNELTADPKIEDNIEQLLSSGFLANHDDTSREKIYSKIRAVEENLGNTVKGDYLFRVTLAGDSRDFNEEWTELFNPKRKRNTLNATITDFILQKNKLLSEKIKEFRKDIKGFCLSFTNIVDHLKLRDKEDFDYLLSLADCNENEFSNENFEKFLNGELHLEFLEEKNKEKRVKKQKLIDAFSLIRYLVEETATLQACNMNIKKDSQFFQKYKTDLPTNHHFASCYETRSFNPKEIQIVLNRPRTEQVLLDLPEGNTIDLSTNGHSVSITKTCNHYIVVDSNGFLSVLCDSDKTQSAEDRLCNVIEIIINKYLHSNQGQHTPYIEYIDTTKINKEVRGLFAKKDENKGGRPYYESESLEFFLHKELISAVNEGNSQYVTSLLNCSADVNAKDEGGMTILSLAAFKGNLEIFNILLSRGACVNAVSTYGLTSLMIAACMGHSEIVSEFIKKLLKHADINIQDNYGNTALHWAAKNGCENALIMLVQAGANISIKNKKGEIALDLAQEYGHQEIVTLLKEKQGASQPPESNVHITGTKKHSSDGRVIPQ